jgi:riboflavin synthase
LTIPPNILEKIGEIHEIAAQIPHTMFTGIVETLGTIVKIDQSGSNISFWIQSGITGELKIDQSLSHDGACLTVEALDGNTHKVTAVAETLQKTCLSSWKTGRIINLERGMILGGRLDGHLVQGHVDATGTCMHINDKNGSWEYRFRFPETHAALVIEKGSICINGISLTAYNVSHDALSVAVIPYTYTHTNINATLVDDVVNIEFDMVGKYINRRNDLHTLE